MFVEERMAQEAEASVLYPRTRAPSRRLSAAKLSGA